MPRPARRSRSLRRIKRKSPGAKTKKRYERRKGTKVKCAVCKKRLQGASCSKELSKTKKHPKRLFSGALCHKCTEQVLKLKTRIREGEIDISDISIKFKKYVESIL
jgi:large subunit ribosomal protein L34e